MAPFVLEGFDPAAFIEAVLAEDLGGPPHADRDVTAAACLPASTRLAARLVARHAMVPAGLALAAGFFARLDPDCRIEPAAADGEAVASGATLIALEGRARAMLAAERSALNTLQLLTGIATETRAYVDAIAGTGATLLDTRKTPPGLRRLAKYAVRMGGGTNHRMGLWDAAMVKDNHIAAAGGVGPAVAACKAAGLSGMMVEVDRLDQIEPAIAAGADRLLLDNMAPQMLKEAVTLVGGRVPTEASGGVRLETIRAIAETGVTFVSVGRITQAAPAADIGMDMD